MTTCSTTYAETEGELSEQVETPIFENLVMKDGGFYLSNENIIALANYIQGLQTENERLQNLVDTFNAVLKEERISVEKLIQEKDNVINLQRQQIDDLKFLYDNSKPTFFDKAQFTLGGAGIAAALLLLAQFLQ